MHIIYKADGSVKSERITDFIQRGNNNVNSIFVAVEDRPNTDWGATVYFELPSGDIEQVVLDSADPTTIDEVEYKGWDLVIPEEATLYYGIVNFSIALKNLSNQTLVTIAKQLTVNPSTKVISIS